MNLKRETGLDLDPKFDASGLITAVCTDIDSGNLLMVAHMNDEALRSTLETKRATFWSRSRNCLWIKGDESGNILRVVEARIDCDQDCIWLKCKPDGPACHTGEISCFYRRIEDVKLARD